MNTESWNEWEIKTGVSQISQFNIRKKYLRSSLEKMLERGSSETLLETEILGRVGMKMMEGQYYRIYERTLSLKMNIFIIRRHKKKCSLLRI